MTEPLTRYCPGCGSIGPVPESFRDCCPDGNQARMIPEPLARKCRDTFKLAVGYALADMQSSAAPGKDKLWCVHVTGADDVHPMPSHSEALHEANLLNAFFVQQERQEVDPIMIAVATEWPHSPESHAAGVAIRAEAIRLRNVPAGSEGAGGVERLRSPAEPCQYPPLPAPYLEQGANPRGGEVGCSCYTADQMRDYFDLGRAARAQAPDPISGNWINADDVERLTRSLDVALNGDDAAPQSSLCDVVGQAAAEARKLGHPLLKPSATEPAYTDRVIEALHENGDPVSIEGAEELANLATKLNAAPNLACKSEQKRLATLWGYVKAAPEQSAADLAPSAAVRAIRDYLGVHDGIKLGGQAMDDMALDIARVVLNSETAKKAKRYDWITRQAWVRKDAQIRLKLSDRCEYDRPLYDHELAKAIDMVMNAEREIVAADPVVIHEAAALDASEPVFSLVPSFRHADIRIDCVIQPGEGHGWFARRFGEVLNKQGEWEHEPQPSNRDAAFYERTLFETPTDAIIAAKAATRSANALPT